MTAGRLTDSIGKSEIMEINGYQYFIHPLSDGIPSIDPEILNEAADMIISRCDLDCDYIVTAETMGIPVTTAVSLKKGIPFTVVRKRRYNLPGETDIAQRTGYSKNSMYINGLKKGDRVVVIDDVLSTGGTMKAILDALINRIGCKVVDAAVIFGKSDVGDEIFDEFGVRVKTLFDTRIVDGKLTLTH
jgi:adenine phosphoribosyltransferase